MSTVAEARQRDRPTTSPTVGRPTRRSAAGMWEETDPCAGGDVAIAPRHLAGGVLGWGFPDDVVAAEVDGRRSVLPFCQFGVTMSP